MATVIQPSSIDVSIQNRDDRVADENEPMVLGRSRPVGSAAERKKRKKNRDVTIPFMILVLMDFMIVLLLWIVYEAVSGQQKLIKYTVMNIIIRVEYRVYGLVIKCDRICENVHSSHKNFNSFF